MRTSFEPRYPLRDNPLVRPPNHSIMCRIEDASSTSQLSRRSHAMEAEQNTLAGNLKSGLMMYIPIRAGEQVMVLKMPQ